MKEVIFREYDIRGIVGSELLLESVYPLGRALAAYLLHKNPHVRTVAIGMDGRVHSSTIAQSLIDALTDSGLDIYFVGICPSPVLYFALQTLTVQAGVMITASHNPAEYNGLKICLGTQALTGVDIRALWQWFCQGKRIESANVGTVYYEPMVPLYISWLSHHFRDLHDLHMPIVIDAGNGAGAAVIPQLIDTFGWKGVAQQCMTVDGTYPNHEADPVVEANVLDIKMTMASGSYVIGFGLDGDADRLGVVTPSGVLVPGDQLLAIFAHDILQDNPHAAIAFDVKVSEGLIELLNEWGAIACMSACGHTLIKQVMRENNAMLGGELSCHFIFNDRYFGYDDGIYAMLRLLQIMHKRQQSLEELVSIFPVRCSSPEIRIVCSEEQKQPIITRLVNTFREQLDTMLITIDGVRVKKPYGWGLVRASNTQPMLSMRFESHDKQGLQQIKNDFYTILKTELNEQQLAHQLNLEG